MCDQDPELLTMKISEAKAMLSTLVNNVHGREKRILIEKAGIPAAALISAEDLVKLERYERTWNERISFVDRVREAFKDGPPDQIGSDIAALLRKMQQEVESEEFGRVLDAMRAPFRNVPPEEIERETAKAVAEVRAEMRAEREAAALRKDDDR
jgi:prevent-host-death family protein